MERYKIQAKKREETGKGTARKIRREGKIPGVIYGHSRDAKPLTLDPRNVNDKLFTNAIFDLTIVDQDGEEVQETAMLKDYQKDVIKGSLLHVDFQYISMDEKVGVTVPVRLKGDAPGVIEGGVLQQLMREIEIEALPADVPDEFELDITELEMNSSLQVADLEVSDDIDIISSLDDVIVTVVAPSEEITEEDEEELLEDEFIEPEVIGEEDEEEVEGEEGAEEAPEQE